MENQSKPCFIVCGVSGSGKTTVGKLLAYHMGVSFYDADDFHPTANINKMKAGIPLNDQDRKVWLEDIKKDVIQQESTNGFVLACSALKEKYREELSSASSEVNWVILKGSRDLILKRINKREDHFFGAELLDSQFNIFEEPTYGWSFDIDQTPEKIIADILDKYEGVEA